MANITLHSLSDYNNGELVSNTFDLDRIDSQDEWLEQIGKWLESVDAEKGNDIYIPKREEWIVCDYEDIPSRYVGTWDIDPGFWEYKSTVEGSHYSEEVFQAAADLDIEPEDVEDCYSGEYSTDEDFAQDMADQLGCMDERNTSWPHTCIDWTYAARELMYDYSESNGHYFRSV